MLTVELKVNNTTIGTIEARRIQCGRPDTGPQRYWTTMRLDRTATVNRDVIGRSRIVEHDPADDAWALIRKVLD